MMIVKGLEWGYDESGNAQGPVAAAAYAQIKAIDENEKEWYILSSLYRDDENIYVASAPVIETAFRMMRGEISEEKGRSAILSHCAEHYSYVLPDIPEEMEASRFYQAIKLSCKALHEVIKIGMFPDRVSAEKFIVDFLDQDCDQIYVQPIPHTVVIEHRFG